MKELTIENLHKTYGTKTLLDGIDLSLRTGDRIGLIGPNGTGKSSFLKTIAGLETSDDGKMMAPQNYRIGYLDQNPDLDPDKTVLETIYDSSSPLVRLVHDYEDLRLQLEKDPENVSLQEPFLRLSEKMTEQNGWDLEIRAKSILTRLGLKNLSQKIGETSGGQQKRAGIAQVLIEAPDLLILDEPTNHLDIASIQWLERYLASYRGALILVTHDRYFLERVVNKIVELRHGKLTEFIGNYESYLEQRAARMAEISRQQDRQDRLFKQELAWMRSGARARTTKQKARIERFENLDAEIQSRHQENEELDFNFSQQRIGNQVLEFEEVSVSIHGQGVLKDFTKTFVAGDRVGIIGPNGVGKSTFLNTIVQDHPIDSGIYKVGQTVSFAYYRQLDEDLPEDVRILSYLMDVADDYKRPDGRRVDASQMLERFNFDRRDHGNLIGSLSGGEKRRLYLLSLLIQEPNVLLLDEPTNDLDIDTLTVLEDYLESFQGVVLVVSHDRYFLDKTVDQLLELQGEGRFTWFWGSYTQYLESQEKAVEKAPTPTLATPKKRSSKEKRVRLSYHERKEWETLPGQIETLENEIDELTEAMEHLGNQPVELMEKHARLEVAELELLDLYERYETLSQKEQ